MVMGSLIDGRKTAAIIIVSMLFMAAYACLNEAFASLYRMVLWKFVPDIALWGGTPILVPFGYAGMSLLFLLSLHTVARRKLSTKIKLLLMILAVAVMIPLHLVWIGLIRVVVKVFL